jgi:hypothetical protein
MRVAKNSGYLQRGKPQLGMVVEAIDPSKWSPTSMSDTYEVFHHLNMLWMCIWLNPYNVLLLSLA